MDTDFYAKKIERLLVTYKLPWQSKKIYMTDVKTLPLIVRWLMGRLRIYKLASHPRPFRPLKSGEMEPFIWTTASRERLFIKKDGMFKEIGFSDLSTELTEDQQAILLSVLDSSAKVS